MMDQASKLRERVQTNQEITNARVIAITSGKVASERQRYL